MNDLASLANLLSVGFSFFAQNREQLMEVLASLEALSCHDAIAVAQDALDAYQHGHLSQEQALQIIKICLEGKQPKKIEFWADNPSPIDLFRQR
ncbi:MAG: hypothetical protein ACRDEA_07670 [Microcystaceae cyanobacterium]